MAGVSGDNEIRKAPIIYLDTQDFIRFRVKRNCAETREVYECLKAKRLAGEILLGYSALHVWEFRTPAVSDRYVGDRMERGKLLVDLCGLNAFPFYSDIRNGAKYPNSGFWVPNDIRKTHLDLDRTMREIVESEIKKRGFKLNRASRRKLSNPRYIRQFIGEAGPIDWRSSSDFGDVSPEIALVMTKYFGEYIKGRVSAGKIKQKMLSWMSNPQNYGYLWHEYGESADAIDLFIFQYLGGLESIISNAIEDIEISRQQVTEARKVVREASKALREAGFSKSTVRSMRPDIPALPKKFEIPSPGEEINVLGDGRLQHIFHYLNLRINGVGKYSRSDVVDLLHMIYVQDCDYFRCDRDMYNLFSDYDPFEGKLVVRIEDIPLL